MRMYKEVHFDSFSQIIQAGYEKAKLGPDKKILIRSFNKDHVGSRCPILVNLLCDELRTEQ